jgi:protein farnesyltransferase/geranylgeranyltransferase type-1 subunit alpha
VLDHAQLQYKNLEEFVKPYTADSLPIPSDSDVTNLENPLPSMGAELPAMPALEFLADIYERDNSSKQQAVDVGFVQCPPL